ncbi:MAG: mechanosensitive ion channel [Nitrospira sp.]|nr:mechanosensitive ion channel [Nitrospira sp.]
MLSSMSFRAPTHIAFPRSGLRARSTIGCRPFRLCVLVLLLVGAAIDRSFAAEQRAIPTPTAASELIPMAPVRLDGRVLFKVRGVSAFPAEQRAGLTEQRLRDIASNESLPLDSLHVEERRDRSLLKFSDELVMTVYDADAEIEGVSRHLLAEAYQRRIKTELAVYRHDRNPEILLTHTIYAVGATTAFLLSVYLLVLGFRRADRLLEKRYQTKVESLRGKIFRFVESELIWNGIRSSGQLVRTMLILFLLFIHSQFVLGLFPWTKALSARLLSLVLDPLQTMGLAVIDAVPRLIFLVILAVVIRYTLKLLKMYFTAIQQGTFFLSGFDADWAMPTYRILRTVTIAFALVVAYPYVPGSDSEAFKGISILLGVIFSLGSSSVVANTIAGYTMIYRRAFKVGDRVMIDQLVGDVTAMRLQVTHLRSLKNEEITIPNSMILNSSVTNFSSLAQERGLILHAIVGVGYETSWRQVEALLLEAARRTEGVLQNPPPVVLLPSLGDFAVQYELNVHSDRPQESPQLYAALHHNILDLFNEHGVQIMTPAYQDDPVKPKIVPKDQWFAPPATPPAT